MIVREERSLTLTRAELGDIVPTLERLVGKLRGAHRPIGAR